MCGKESAVASSSAADKCGESLGVAGASLLLLNGVAPHQPFSEWGKIFPIPP